MLIFHNKGEINIYFLMMMNTAPIIAKAFINNQGEYLKECSVCFEVEQQMLRCLGACQSFYCATCVSRRRLEKCENQNKYCCNYSPLSSVKCEKIKYFCPYNRQLCKIQIQSSRQFWKHCEECAFITSQAKEEMKNKRQYRCQYGHRLIFVTAYNFYQIYFKGRHHQTTNSETCTYCLQKFLCKSVCLLCGVGDKKGVYCINCRPIPCQKNCCPLGHEFSFKKWIRAIQLFVTIVGSPQR